MKKTIAVIGANGFVGRAICKEIIKYEKFELLKITRLDDMAKLIDKSDIVIHSANSSKRYYANNNPKEDFFDTVEKMFQIKNMAANKKMVLISTASARVQLNTPYGRNRRACELMIDQSKNLIFRLGPMFGSENYKGPLYDIIKNNRVYVDEKTKYAYVSVEYNAKKIVELLNRTGIIELGAKNAIELGYLKEKIGSTSIFEGHNDTQILSTTQKDAPDSFDVITFAKKEILDNIK
tara:strand:+ start:749 stop:1456 length:708 start_codon:yes stop_codon:yes gene_type:complete